MVSFKVFQINNILSFNYKLWCLSLCQETPTYIQYIVFTLLSNTYLASANLLFEECPCIFLYQFQKFPPNSHQVSISCSVGHNFNDIYNYMYDFDNFKDIDACASYLAIV